jgi:hypothetical protein
MVELQVSLRLTDQYQTMAKLKISGPIVTGLAYLLFQTMQQTMHLLK